MRSQRVTILSTADFDSAVWTNKQHLATGLVRAGIEVEYIESFGLREPRVSKADLTRALRRVRRMLPSRRSASDGAASRPTNLSPPGAGNDRPRVVSPIVIPFHRFSGVRLLNRLIVRLTLLPRLSRGEGSVLWTFSPLTYGLERYFDTTVYHSVDLLHHQERAPGALLLESEARLLSHASNVIASSVGVRRHLESLGCSDVLLWENVADVGVYAGVREPRVQDAIFAGNLTPAKIDIGLLRGLVDAGVGLVLAGPVAIDGTDDGAIRELLAHDRVTYLGNLAPRDLARALASAKVGLIPYATNPYTRGVFPMKVFEYMAAGLSVVTTPLPSLAEHGDILHVEEGLNFVRTVADEVSSFSETAAERRRQIAQNHSWERRIEQAVGLLGARDE